MLAIFFLATALCWYGVFRWRRRRLYELAARVPGLPELPLVGHAHNLVGNTQNIMKYLQRTSLHAVKNYGISKVWIGSLIYFVLTDPADIEMILKTFLEKDDVRRFFCSVLGNGLVFAPVSIWRPRRKIMTSVFNPRVLESYVETFAEHSDTLAQRLAAQHGTTSFSTWSFLCRYTLESIYETVFGKNITENDKEFILSSMKKLLHNICRRIFHLWLQPDWLYRFFPDYKETETLKESVYSHIDAAINNGKDQIKSTIKNEIDNNYEASLYNKKNILQRLITSSGKYKEYSNVEMREEVMTILTACTDSSAVALGFTLMLLSKYPDVQDRAYQELCDVFGETRRQLVKEDLPKLVYLERVVKESLRLFPPAPIVARKIEKEIILPSGHVLPAGSCAVISIWGAHRDPVHWGPDAEHFDPDRFLPERHQPQHACSYIPFSNGPRNCMGSQYGMMSLKTSLANILRRCHILGESESTPIPQIDIKYEIMIKSTNNFTLKLVKRA